MLDYDFSIIPGPLRVFHTIALLEVASSEVRLLNKAGSKKSCDSSPGDRQKKHESMK